MSNLAYLFLLLLAFYMLVKLVKHQREIDTSGNAVLRILSIPLLGYIFFAVFLGIGIFNLEDPFHKKYPENSFVEFGLAVFGLLGGLLVQSIRITLCEDEITEKIGPFWKRSYSLHDLVAVEPNPAKSGITVMRFRGGRQLSILDAYVSGRPYFLERVREECCKLEINVNGL